MLKSKNIQMLTDQSASRSFATIPLHLSIGMWIFIITAIHWTFNKTIVCVQYVLEGTDCN